jgi:diacylglycerol kinase family enzyme
MKIAVIINASAGSGDSYDDYKRLKEAFNRKNVKADFIELYGDNIKDKIVSLTYPEYYAIAAAGGDGTINSVLNMTIDSKLSLGIIPMGTLNHFAKDAGIPLEIEDAVDVIVNQHTVMVDIAEVNGKYFLNNSSVGLYPKMVKQRDKEMEVLKYGKWFAMFRAILNIFSKYPLITFRIKTEDHYNVIKTPFIFVGNNVYTFDLFSLGKRERIDEGTLSLYYPKTTGRFSILRFAFMALINKLDSTEDFYNSRCDEISVNSRRRTLEVSVDGEVLHLNPPLNYKIHPRKLRLLIPENR